MACKKQQDCYMLDKTKLILRCTGLPAWLFSKSKMKILQLKKHLFNFFIALDFIKKINKISVFDVFNKWNNLKVI